MVRSPEEQGSQILSPLFCGTKFDPVSPAITSCETGPFLTSKTFAGLSAKVFAFTAGVARASLEGEQIFGRRLAEPLA